MRHTKANATIQVSGVFARITNGNSESDSASVRAYSIARRAFVVCFVVTERIADLGKVAWELVIELRLELLLPVVDTVHARE